MFRKLAFVLLFAALSYAKTFFSVQLMSANQRQSINDALLTTLKKEKIEYSIIKKDENFKLLSGTFKTMSEAKKRLNNLKKLQPDAFITQLSIKKSKNGSDYIATKTIQIMAVSHRSSITDSALRIIKKHGYKFKINKQGLKYYLLVGEFNSENELQRALKNLKMDFGEAIFARSIDRQNSTVASYTKNTQPEKNRNIYGGVVFSGINIQNEKNLRLNSSLGAGFQFGMKLPYDLLIQSQYLYYPKIRERRINSDNSLSKANRRYHQLNLSLKKELPINSKFSLYPKAGLSISRYDINKPDTNYLRYQALYDTSDQEKILFNPHLGLGLSYDITKDFQFDFEYLYTFELDIHQTLLSLNYQY